MDMQASLLSSGTNSVSPDLSQGPQNILSSNYQYDGTPANAVYKAPAAPQYAYDGTPANAVYKAPFSPQVAQYNRPPADASYMAGVAPPVQVSQQTASTPSVADAVANQNVINPVADVSPTMNYVPMVPRTPIAPPPDANIFQSIANAMLPENLFPNALYTQPTPPGQYLVQAPENRGILSGYMAEPFRIDRDIGVATIPTTGMPNPNANVITTASGRQMAFNPARGQYEYVSRFDGSLDDRPGGNNREENRKNIEDRQVRRLLAMGYSQEDIDEMSADERQDLIRTSANGGRIQYKKGGEATKSTGKDSYQPLSLPPMPEYRPYTLPQYTMPSASPLVADFMGSLSQPIPPVQMPQYQSMVSPLQNTQASFVNPAMGNASSVSTPGAGFGVNALRYNPMLMDERPDYALTENNSLSNALRLMRG